MKSLLQYSFIMILIIASAPPALAERLAYAPDKKIIILANKTSKPNSGILIKKENQSWEDLAKSGSYNAVAYGDGLFVAVGDHNAIGSFDGTQWNVGKGPDLDGNGILNAVRYIGNSAIGNKWIAVGTYKTGGSGGIWTSADGKNWNNRVKSRDWYDLSAIAHDGKYNIVAVGKRGQYVYSHDGGRTIFSGSVAGIADFHDVTYANGLFVAVAGLSTIYYSPNGEQWMPGTISGLNENVSLNKVIYSPDMKKFIIVGDYNEKGMTVLDSTDGRVWKRIYIDVRFPDKVSLTSLALGKQGVYTSGYALRKGSSTLYFLGKNSINVEDDEMHAVFFEKNTEVKPVTKDIDSLIALDGQDVYAIGIDEVYVSNLKKYYVYLYEGIDAFYPTSLPGYWKNEHVDRLIDWHTGMMI